MTARRYLLLIFATAVTCALVFGLIRRDETPVPPAAETAAAPVDPAREEAAAAHILIAHVESTPSIAGVTRTRLEAQDQALRVAAALQSKRAPFADLARQYSDDPNVEINDGYLGIFKRGDLPLPLEVPLFELAVGHFDATVETRRGFHLLMRQPVRRAVARHILISWSGARDATAGLRRNRAQAELLVDEVLAMFATDEVDFCDLSSRFSDDPESRFECGLLGVIEPAVLPRPMEAELFSLRPGEVSGKIETEFGFHILKRDD